MFVLAFAVVDVAEDWGQKAAAAVLLLVELIFAAAVFAAVATGGQWQ